MTFLNPLILFGLAAASIPVLLHLLNLRKLKTVEFSTLRFIKELQKTKIRRLKLKQIILLILRTLLVIFAVLAFARPTIESSLPVFQAYSKTSAVILIDNSFSMDVSDEFGNRFNQAKNSALSIIESLEDGDEAVIIPMAGSPNRQQFSFSRNFSLLLEQAGRMQVSNSSANLESGLKLAASLLEESINLNRDLFIITDGQKNIFASIYEDSLRLSLDNTGIIVIQPGYESEAEIQNYSVDSLSIISSIFQIDKIVEAEARIRNNSNKDIKGLVASLLFNGERVSQRSLDIAAGKTSEVAIGAAPKEPGAIKAAVELENDALDIDNKRWFGFIIPDRPKVAIIGGNSHTAFLGIALKGNSNNDRFVDYKSFNTSDFPSVELDNYDIVFFASGPYGTSDFQRLETYVRAGGSAIVFADPLTNENIFSAALEKLGLGKITTATFLRNKPGEFTSVDKIHPIFDGVFTGTTNPRAIVESPKIYSAMPVSGGNRIIDMQGGGFMSENKPGDGRLIYFAVSPTNEMSTFPLTGLFPAVLYRSIIYLSEGDDLGIEAEPGKALTITLPKKFSAGGNFTITDPLGNEFYKQAAILPGGAVLSFDELDKIGIYVVSNSAGKLTSIISVNPPPSESDLTFAARDEFESSLMDIFGKQAGIEFVDHIGRVPENIIRAKAGTELWQLFLLAALLCALAEMLVERNTKADTEN